MQEWKYGGQMWFLSYLFTQSASFPVEFMLQCPCVDLSVCIFPTFRCMGVFLDYLPKYTGKLYPQLRNRKRRRRRNKFFWWGLMRGNITNRH